MENVVTLTQAQIVEVFRRWNARLVAEGVTETADPATVDPAEQAEAFCEFADAVLAEL